MIRLSFRDMMWYCYLEQAGLDSTFYRLKEPIVMGKSRDVMRFVVGYYTERLQDLELQLDTVVNGRATKVATSEQIRVFLQQFGYGTEEDIRAEMESVNQQLTSARQEQVQVREGFNQNTHFVDRLREQLRKMSDRLGQEEQTLADQGQRVSEFQALKAELVTARFKMARMEAASSVLSGVKFERCPVVRDQNRPTHGRYSVSSLSASARKNRRGFLPAARDHQERPGSKDGRAIGVH